MTEDQLSQLVLAQGMVIADLVTVLNEVAPDQMERRLRSARVTLQQLEREDVAALLAPSNLHVRLLEAVLRRDASGQSGKTEGV